MPAYAEKNKDEHNCSKGAPFATAGANQSVSASMARMRHRAPLFEKDRLTGLPKSLASIYKEAEQRLAAIHIFRSVYLLSASPLVEPDHGLGPFWQPFDASPLVELGKTNCKSDILAMGSAMAYHM